MPVEVTQRLGKTVIADAKEFSIQAVKNGEIFPVGQCKPPCNHGPGGPPPKCGVPAPKCIPCTIEQLT